MVEAITEAPHNDAWRLVCRHCGWRGATLHGVVSGSASACPSCGHEEWDDEHVKPTR